MNKILKKNPKVENNISSKQGKIFEKKRSTWGNRNLSKGKKGRTICSEISDIAVSLAGSFLERT